MDKAKIIIEEMSLDVLVGVYKEERFEPQTVLVDLDLTLTSAGRFNQCDDITSEVVLNYEEVIKLIRKECGKTKFYLLESLADFVSNLLFTYSVVERVRLKVVKTNLLGVSKLGVVLERTRD